MANVTIRYSCGCGAHMPKTEDALAHCDKMCHIITVSGIIRPTVTRKSHTVSAQSAQRTAHTPHWSSNSPKEPIEKAGAAEVTASAPPVPPIDFSFLRKKISGLKKAQTQLDKEEA